MIHLGGQMNSDTLLGEELSRTARDRLQKDQIQPADEPTLEELLYYTDFADAFMLLNRNKAVLPKPIAREIQDRTNQFEALAPIRNRIAHSRPLNFDDLAVTLDFAQELCSSGSPSWECLRATLAKLKSDPSFVCVEIRTLSDTTSDTIKHNLPTPDFDETGFAGRQQQVDELIKACRGPYPVISVIGEGVW